LTPPRLLLVLPHLALGGGERATMMLAELLAERFPLSICALDYGPPPAGPTIRHELRDRFADAAFARRRCDLVPHLARADVVLWYGISGAVPRALGRLRARPASIRVVHTSRAADGVRFHRRFRRVIDATVAVSPAVARRIPGAVFIPNLPEASRLRGRRRRLFRDGPTLGFLGRLLPQKNAAWLVERLAQLGVNLLLQGLDTELQRAADLERLAAAAGTGDRLRLLPAGRDAGTLLRSVDALALLSRHEGLPLVVLEAGRLATPVVATPAGALPELFADAILFVDQDAAGQPRTASLRRALDRLEPSWGERLARRVAELCDRDAVAARWARLIRTSHRRHLAA